MKRLSGAAFDRAQRFLEGQARPIDRALFRFRFAGAPADAVEAALLPYQNPDGGFGQALEPDLRTPSSSALATGLGLTVLKEIGCPAARPIVRRAVEFLLATFNEPDRVWRVVPHDTDAYPHAPWWSDEEGALARTFDGFGIIPRAQLVGLLYHFAGLVPAAWLDALAESTTASIEATPIDRPSGDDLSYALSLAETASLPARFKTRLVAWLRAAAPTVVTRDPARWASYCIPPLKLAPRPDSPLADLLGDDLARQLDYEIERQAADGGWDVTWSWGPAYPQTWPQARAEWRGHLTLRTLTALRAHGRLPAAQGPVSGRPARAGRVLGDRQV